MKHGKHGLRLGGIGRTDRRMWILWKALLAGVLSGVLGLACGLSDVQTYDVTGVVEAVDRDASQLKIAHDDIPGLMPAMTMSFDVASPEVFKGVVPGSRVRFKLERTATSLRILELRVTGVTEPSGAPDVGLGTLLETAPSFRLVDQEGVERSFESLRGRAVLVDFVFTNCPGPCPILTSQHVALQRALPAALAERTQFVSISLDPQRDTPEALRDYATARGADQAHWWFLTGEPEVVSDVVTAWQVGSIRRADGNIDHLVATYLVAPDGRIAKRYVGLEHGTDEIVADLRDVLR